MNLDQDVRTMLRERAERVAAAPVVPDGTVRRVRVRKALWAGGVALGVAAIAVAGVFARSAMWTDAAPVPPADETERETEPMRNGRIITGEWQAFDQNTGSFLYAGTDAVLGPGTVSSHLGVVRQNEIVAEFDCPASAGCGGDVMGMATFGPGPDEVTAAGGDDGLGLVHVLGFDGTLRDTLDISVATPDQEIDGPLGSCDVRKCRETQALADLAWSPDGSRLAISTEPDCDYNSISCEGRVWVLDRDGGEPQLVFTERAPDVVDLEWGPPVFRLGELAWSPDGRSLTLLVASLFPDDYANHGVWPRLVVLRLQPGQPVRAETLHVYDDVDMPGWNILGDWPFYFASAWSPDGTRIAVTGQDGITEISAEDGHVLARHPRKNPIGLLAWLPKR